MRSHFILPVACLMLGVPAVALGSGRALHVRASLDDSAAPAPVSPRRIRSTLEEGARPSAQAPGHAEFPLDEVAPGPTPGAHTRRLFRLTLGSEPPPPTGRVIRLSLEDAGQIYGRLSRSGTQGRYVRTSLE